MRHGQSTLRSLLWVVIAAAAVAAGCGAKPPYHVSEPQRPTAEQLERLGRIDLAAPPASAPAAGGGATPRVWIGINDRTIDGAGLGAILGAAVGAAAGALIAGPNEGELDFTLERGAVVGAAIGAPIGGVIGAQLAKPGAEARAAAAELRRVAAAVDVSALAREGALRSANLQAYRDAASAAGTGGTLSVDVVAYGTRAWKANKVRPFVAVRTRLADASTGQVMYDSTSDVRGEGRDLTKWSGDATEFRRELETLARTLGTRSADRALTPRK